MQDQVLVELRGLNAWWIKHLWSLLSFLIDKGNSMKLNISAEDENVILVVILTRYGGRQVLDAA
jgi:hypothetical protein